MSDAIFVRDWNVDGFHRQVLQLETQGYVARRETYRITAETNPEKEAMYERCHLRA